MSAQHVESHELVLAAEPTAPAVARRVAADFARHQGAPPDVAHAVELAVSEAVSNAVVHAYAGTADGAIRLAMERGRGTLDVLVADDGKGMAPRTDSPGLGLGLPLIGRLADRFDVRSRPGRGTEIRMRFALSPV